MRERKRESDSEPEELAASVERCVYTVIDILRGEKERETRRCACERVKRRDIFYIYGYLPLLCSRADGLR